MKSTARFTKTAAAMTTERALTASSPMVNRSMSDEAAARMHPKHPWSMWLHDVVPLNGRDK
ncbi:hypothetical protein AB4Z09_24380 [Rhodococcus sp. TAF43]|uniref:hypothetical protein n=1 Tax=Rhodococcus sp. TAF43 TaxID=3237483 RepID=UPI003F9743B9